MFRNVAVGITLFTLATPGWGGVQEIPSDPKDQPGKQSVSMETEFRVMAPAGSDITQQLQQKIDEARAAGGGTVLLPAGSFILSDTVKLAGSPDRFPQGGANLILRGGPTQLTYAGEPNRTLLDIEAPNQCTLSNLTLDGDNIPGTVGIRYRAGYERGVNGGKGNEFINISLSRFDIGLWIGDPFAPDLVGSGFHSLAIQWCRIGLLVEGGNVAGMTFYNPLISGYREAGIKLVGYAARVIRRTSDDPLPSPEASGMSGALTDFQTGAEIFEQDVPAYALERRAFRRDYQGQSYYWAPGGAPEIALYNANFGGQAINAWAIDSNWGNIRIYSARVEGVQGFYRRSSTLPPGRFTDLFFDVNATSYGGATGHVLEYNGPGPFYIYGGSFSGSVALGNKTRVYASGVRFEKGKFPFYPGLLPPDFDLPEGSRIVRTGEKEMFPGRFGAYDRAQVPPVEQPGFVQLPGTRGAEVISGGQEERSGSAKVQGGQRQVHVTLSPALPDAHYRVSALASFDSGSVWVSEKTPQGFLLNWKNLTTPGAEIDWLIKASAVRMER